MCIRFQEDGQLEDGELNVNKATKNCMNSILGAQLNEARHKLGMQWGQMLV